MAPLDGWQLCWSSRHQNDLLEVGVPSYLGLAPPRYQYGPANLVGRPRRVTFRGRCALVALPVCSGHPGFYVRMKASLWGAHLTALPNTSGCLGAFNLRPYLGRHASGGSARLLVAMRDIWVSLHSICSRSTYFHSFVSNGF
jgi:hypothetical protein